MTDESAGRLLYKKTHKILKDENKNHHHELWMNIQSVGTNSVQVAKQKFTNETEKLIRVKEETQAWVTCECMARSVCMYIYK